MTKILERSSPYVNLTKDQIQKCIDPLDKETTIKDYRLATSGLANTNYIVTLSNDAKVVLRIHSNNNFDKGQKERKLSDLLYEIPEVPKVLYYQSKNNDGISYSIIEFIPGVILPEIDNKEALDSLYYEIGLMLAKLRSIKFPTSGLLGDQLEIIPIKTKHIQYHGVTNFVLDCLDDDNLQRRVNIDLINDVRNIVIQNDFLLLNTNEESHLVHGDFKIENIIVDKSVDSKLHLSGVLDWENARSDSSYGDIATLFRGDYIKNSANKIAFYEGFTKNGIILIKDWDKVSKLIDLVNICYFLCSKNDRPILFKVMTEHLKNTINYCK